MLEERCLVAIPLKDESAALLQAGAISRGRSLCRVRPKKGTPFSNLLRAVSRGYHCSLACPSFLLLAALWLCEAIPMLKPRLPPGRIAGVAFIRSSNLIAPAT